MKKMKITIKGVGFFGTSEKKANVVFLKLEKNEGYNILREIIHYIVYTLIENDILNEKDLKKSHIKFENN
jgi:2'-5' RNA ligase